MHGAEWKSEGKADSETDEESHVDDSDPDQGQEGLKKRQGLGLLPNKTNISNRPSNKRILLNQSLDYKKTRTVGDYG